MTKLKELEKRLRDEPDNLGLRVSVAGALHEAGRRDDAVELYRSVAIAYRDRGRPQQAITVCRSILELAPGDAACHELLAALLASQPAPRAEPPPAAPAAPEPPASGVVRPSPPRLPQPPSPAPGGAEPVRRSSGDLTPLPLPLPYHDADPTTGSLVRLSRSDLPAGPREELTSYPETAGIAAAARQISASLIAATRREAVREADTEELDDEDLAAEVDTGRLLRDGGPRKVPSASVPPPIPRPRTEAPPVARPPTPPPIGRAPAPPPEPDTAELPEAMRAGVDPDDDDPTLPPPPGPPPTTIDDEKTEPRDLPVRARPPSSEAGSRGASPVGSLAPPTAATGPLAGAFFAPLPPASRGAVLQRFRRRIVAAGTVVIRRGDTDHGLVLVVRGRLDVHAERPDGARIAVGALGPGEFAGEASLLARAPAAADVVAGGDAELLVLPAEDFHDVTRAFPALRAELEAVAGRRARDHEQRRKG